MKPGKYDMREETDAPGAFINAEKVSLGSANAISENCDPQNQWHMFDVLPNGKELAIRCRCGLKKRKQAE